MKYYILYNPLAGSGECIKKAQAFVGDKGAVCEVIDITQLTDGDRFISETAQDDVIVVCGGDGTLNRFANSITIEKLQRNIYYYPCGTGNDFYKDIGSCNSEGLIKLNDYLKNLPTVFTEGEKLLFVNGVGYGVDGYCCEEINRLKSLKRRNVSYPLVALKGLLFAYKPTNAKINVDGECFSYSKVWLASVMLGKFFGGGIKIAPNQERMGKSGKISLVIAHGLGKLDIIRLFPSIFKGTHIKHKKFIAVHEGYDITVEFDRSCTMQIDGETNPKISICRVLRKKPDESIKKVANKTE